jgi:dTDP-4-dehydrorhamnose reductase
VHFSTDYVFDGSKASPYEEGDPTNPLNVYGKTKLAGEEAVRGSGCSHLIFRISWVYSTRRQNFLLTILRLATEREELKVVCDQTGSPTHARNIAATTTRVLACLLEREKTVSKYGELSGTYHMTAAGETTWYDFASAILEQASIVQQEMPWLTAATYGRPLRTRRIMPIATKEYRSPARRPLYSVLSNQLLARTFGVTLPSWHDQLLQCFARPPLEP